MDNRVECTVHLIAYDREQEWDLFIPGKEVPLVIQRLIDSLDLATYIEGPTQSQATLHVDRSSPPIDPAMTLGEAGVVDGDHLWLILTPTQLPLTIHWRTHDRSATEQVELQAGRSVEQQIGVLLAQFGLQEYVDGPHKSLVTLTRTVNGSALSAEKNLLELKIAPFSELWLNITPQYLPYIIHWEEMGEPAQKEMYLALDTPIQQHINDLVRRIPGAQGQIDGPQQSTVTLQYLNQPLDQTQTLRHLQLPPKAALKLSIKPTVGAITVQHQPEAAAAPDEATLWLPLHEPIKQLTPTIAESLHISPSHHIQLQHDPVGKALNANKSFADHGISTEATLWLTTQVAPAAAGFPRRKVLVLAGGVLALLIIGFLIFTSGADQTPVAEPTVVAQIVPTATPELVPTVTLAPQEPSPTPDLEAQKRIDYALGREAYAQQDWATAAAAFQRIYELDPDYLDLDEIGSATFYNWSVSLLQSEDDLQTSLEMLQETFVFSPSHQLGRTQETVLEAYAEALQAIDRQDWEAAIEALEPLYEQDSAFLNTTQHLYDSYLAYAIELEEADELGSAIDYYALASELPVEDASQAEERLVALLPTPTPRPAPTATPRPEPTAVAQPASLRFVKLNEDDDPACVSVQVVGIDTSGWFFTVDGIESVRGSFNFGHARACGLSAQQQVTFTVKNAQGQPVRGGSGIPTRGSAIMYAEWR